MSDLKDDISYMRGLAEQGRRGSIIGGVFLAAAGVVFGLTCVVQWGVASGHLPDAMRFGGHLWIVAIIVFAALFALLFFRYGGNRTPGAAGASNIAFGVAWGGAALGILVSVAALSVLASVAQLPEVQYAVAPVVFAFYGTAWFIAGSLARRNWMHLVAGVSFIFSLLMAWQSRGIEQVGLMGVALLLTLTVPGIVMMRQAGR